MRSRDRDKFNMIEYKVAKTEEDYDKVFDLCKEADLNSPEGVVLMAVNTETGELVGLLGISLDVYIEPMISRNPVIANNLFYMAVGMQTGRTDKIHCVLDEGNSLIEMYEKKLGFKVRGTKVIMRKEL